MKTASLIQHTVVSTVFFTHSRVQTALHSKPLFQHILLFTRSKKLSHPFSYVQKPACSLDSLFQPRITHTICTASKWLLCTKNVHPTSKKKKQRSKFARNVKKHKSNIELQSLSVFASAHEHQRRTQNLQNHHKIFANE